MDDLMELAKQVERQYIDEFKSMVCFDSEPALKGIRKDKRRGNNRKGHKKSKARGH